MQADGTKRNKNAREESDKIPSVCEQKKRFEKRDWAVLRVNKGYQDT